MFKRRTARSLVAQFFSLIWPKMGWRRAISYYWHRLKRIPGTPESIAMGFACGVAASMMPFMGFHFLLSALFAWILRGSVIASAFGTIVGNPWTFPFIWVGTYKIGVMVFGIEHLTDDQRPVRTMFRGLYHSIQTFDVEMFVEQVMPTLVPMLVGSIPLSIIVGVAAYFIVLRPIRAVHKLRQDRKSARESRYASAEGRR